MRAAFAILSCAMLCGCVQPPKRNPAPASVSIPEAWSIPAAAGAVADRWWEQFGSAELNQIVVETLERNFDLQAAAARVEAAEEEARIAGAALIPTVDATFDAARAQRAFVGLPIPGAPGGVLKSRATSYGVGLVSSWELDLWGRIRAGKQAALAEFQA
ncbi:MAG TPA: TolC family protein, partial [Methylomirabilota bacterium]|nr:TolC family protein [Methylomirabilota bacterium]